MKKPRITRRLFVPSLSCFSCVLWTTSRKARNAPMWQALVGSPFFKGDAGMRGIEKCVVQARRRSTEHPLIPIISLSPFSKRRAVKRSLSAASSAVFHSCNSCDSWLLSLVAATRPRQVLCVSAFHFRSRKIFAARGCVHLWLLIRSASALGRQIYFSVPHLSVLSFFFCISYPRVSASSAVLLFPSLVSDCRAFRYA